MTGKPRVSVVMIFFNAERFIGEAIESVLAQTFEDWELLLVDDGSTDGSTEAALGYCRLHPRKLSYLSHPGHQNRGISASQNLGIAKAKGEYLAFLDADDVWEGSKLDEQVAILEAEPEAAMVYGATLYWYSWTGRTEDAGRDLIIAPGVQVDAIVEPPVLLNKLLLGEAPVPCPSDVLARRNLIQTVGGFEDEFRRIFTDQVLYAKLLMRFPVHASSRCWFKYRKHPDSCVSVVKSGGQMRSARLGYLRWLETYLAREGVKDRTVWKSVKVAKWRCSHPRLSNLGRDTRYQTLILTERLRSAARALLPVSAHRALRARWHRIVNQLRRAERSRP